jgi:protein SCO1/2
MRIAGSIATLVLLSILVTNCSRPPAFQGTALDPPRPALDFTLTDQFGHALRFTELREKVVVLTFLYTACPDVCPLVTQKIRDVATRLGDYRRDVAIVAVTVDPTRDTVAQAAAYSRQWDMLDRWHFLTGSEAALTPLWRYYWAGAVHRETVGRAGPAAYTVAHAAPVHLIDQRGRVRVVYGSEFGPADLVHDIEILLQRG